MTNHGTGHDDDHRNIKRVTGNNLIIAENHPLPVMSENNRTRQAAFKQRMRLAGKKQITIWVTPEEEQSVRILLGKDVSPEVAETPSKVASEEKKRTRRAPVPHRPTKKSAKS